MKLVLDMNPSLEYVKVKLEGGGTLFIDNYKKEHKDALNFELVNLILEHLPDRLEFISVESELLIDSLADKGIVYDKLTGKLSY